ncbi:hypothetical protein HDU91_006538 [Kappamyces sp. JEL0680]|nr:hypothetical protein HDU91_006538 [Kappamyces sp. JEL0680]
MELGKSRQLAALVARAYSYQKRQNFTNGVCIVGCPVVMVLICFTLGLVIQNALNASAGQPTEYVLCSRERNMNQINIPYWSNSSAPFPVTEISDANRWQFGGSTLSSVQHVNWGYFPNWYSPCQFWYEEGYTNSDIYSQSPAPASGKLIRDSSFVAQPVGGWLPNIMDQFNDTSATRYLVNATTSLVWQMWQQHTSVVVAYSDNVNAADVGSKPMLSPLPIKNYTQLPASPPFQSPQSLATGLLGSIPTRYYLSVNSMSIHPVPYYNHTTGADEAIDDYIAASIRSVSAALFNLDKSALRGTNATAKTVVNNQATELVGNLVHGGIYFTNIDHANKQYAWNYHFGTSDILYTARRQRQMPFHGQRMLYQQTQLDNAILRNGNVAGLGNAQITHGFRMFPYVANTLALYPIASWLGLILFPFGVSFLLPVFAVLIVQEKEQRILIMCKMNGMKTHSYYISHYLTFLVLYCFSAFVFIVAGKLCLLTMMTMTENAVLALVFFLWGNNLIALAFLLSTFFSKSRNALIFIFLLVLCSVISALAVNQIFEVKVVPTGFFVWPPFAFYRILDRLAVVTYTKNAVPYSMSQLVPGNEVFTAIVCMVVEWPIVLLLTLYSDAVTPSEFGITRPWHFPVSAAALWWRTRGKTKHEVAEQERSLAVAIQIDASETVYEDEDVKAERVRVSGEAFRDADYPLVMRNMRKVYSGRGGQGPKLAVKDVSFAVEEGCIFGLLGPNGAGKSTLISILTGLYESSAGEAKIAGFNVKSHPEEVYRRIGICPQFDIHWGDLTVGEHLYFYARVKGVASRDERAAVDAAMEEVSLKTHEHRLARGLSGGERRRLSIAIALLGNPKVVFFDEPTTGLDPEVRRMIWDVIEKAKRSRTLILTTHSMEEAEALCQRVGIMARGTLRCCAGLARLKELYGSGFKLYFNASEEDVPRACRFVESILPSGWRKADSFATNISYEFPTERFAVSKLFTLLTAEKSAYGIHDFGVSQTTLEEVFVKLISDADASSEL